MEMARAAGEIAGERRVHKIKGNTWTSPVIVAETPRDIHIRLYSNLYLGEVEYEVISKGEANSDQRYQQEQTIVHAQGKLVYGDPGHDLADEKPGSEWIDIESVKKRCPALKQEADVYRMFQAGGLTYGSSFRSIRELYSNGKEALSVLELPAECREGFGAFGLHPSLLDGALQTAAGLVAGADAEPFHLCLPFALGEVQIIRPSSKR